MESDESDEIKEMWCETCYKDGIKNTIAVGFCTSCVEYLCTTCVRYHKKYLSQHGLKDEDEMPKDHCFDLCPTHSTEVIKFYCKTCDSTACAQCKGEQHTNCNIYHLPDLISEFEKSPELDGLENKIMKVKRTLESLKRRIAKGEKRTEKLRSAVTDAVKRQRDKMISQFDHFEENINNITSKIHDEDLAQLQEQMIEAVTFESELNFIEIDLLNMKMAQQRCKLFIKTKSAVKEVDKMEGELENLKHNVAVQDYSYEAMETGGERPLGSIRTGNKQNLTNDVEAFAADVRLEVKIAWQLLHELFKAWKYMFLIVVIFLAALNIKVNMFYILLSIVILFFPLSVLWQDSFISVGYDYVKGILAKGIIVTSWIYVRLGFDNVKDWSLFCNLQAWYKQIPSSYINVKTKNNETCNITGFCFLSPIHLAIVDNQNSSVKVIDIQQESVITELVIGGKLPFNYPWDVTKVSSDQLAVTVPHSETICFLQLTCCFGLELISLSLARTLSVNCCCYGIAYNNNKLIIACTRSDTGPSVKILDKDGNLLQSFHKDSNGESLFSCPYYVIISRSGSSMYASDFKKQRVVRLSMDGTVLAVFKNEKLKDTFGITIDKTGKVYVCGCTTVFKLSEDLTEGQQVLDIDRASNAIAFLEKTNSFWIGFHYTDVIRHFSFAFLRPVYKSWE